MNHLTSKSIKALCFLAFSILFFSCGTTEQETSQNDPQTELELEPILEGGEQDWEIELQPRDPLSPEQIAYNDQLDKEFNAKIPKKAWSALKEYDPDFETWTSHDFAQNCGQPYLSEDSSEYENQEEVERFVPWGVIGDFNEDRKEDLALMGHTKTHDLLLVAMRKGSSYEITEVLKHEPVSAPKEYGLDYYLEFMENCVISIPNEDYSFPLHGDAFIQVQCEGSDILLYLEEGEFQGFPLTNAD